MSASIQPILSLACAVLLASACAPSVAEQAPAAPSPEPAAATATPSAEQQRLLSADTVVLAVTEIELAERDSFALTRLAPYVADASGTRLAGIDIGGFLRGGAASIDGDIVRSVEPGEAVLYIVADVLERDTSGAVIDRRLVTRVAVVVRPGPVATIELEDVPQRLFTGTATPLRARALSERGSENEDVALRWSSDRPDVASVDERGIVDAHAPGRATLHVRAGDVTREIPITVAAHPVRSIDLTPARQQVRTGDVVEFVAVPLDAAGREVGDVPVTFAVHGTERVDQIGASIYPDGAFVAQRPGLYRVTASSGGAAAEAIIEAEPRGVAARAVRVGAGNIAHTTTSDLWAFRGRDGRDYVYTGTHSGGQKMFAWDVTDPAQPVLTDSVVVDARVVNDVKVNQAASIAVITREGASNRRNGIVLLDLADPAHPAIVSEYTETLSGGVHNTFIVDDLVYAIHNGTLDVHIIDISDPANPHEVGRWGIERPRKYLHDIWVIDGLAYVSYWDDGVYILDVGDGRWGGTPTEPVEVSSYRYRTTWGDEQFGNTHVAFPYRNSAGKSYLFVGDEIFGCDVCISRTGVRGDGARGHVHVIDIDDPERPIEVASYRVPEAGVHNVWVEDDKLYAAYYQGGLRVVDVSGTLRGELYEQGREIAWFPTASPDGFTPNSPMAWGPMPYKGNVFVSDMNSGLWIIRIEAERPRAVLP
ncbi:MAG: Ig-like domain-containing protein [Longimicrobiales bacterium]